MARKLTPTVKCEVCYERFKALTGHLKKHKLSTKEYKEQFKDAPIISQLTQRRMQLARLRFILRKQRKAWSKPATPAGYVRSAETREKIRQIRLGTKMSDAQRAAISRGLMGHKVSEECKQKLRDRVITEEMRQRISASQSAEKGNAWKGGKSRHLYFGKGKYRLKKIFGDPLKCFFPSCDVVEGVNARSIDCHHLDGDHENNPLDGTNWLPLCRRHHMLADGRLSGISSEEFTKANKTIVKIHNDYLKKNYVGEIKTYHE